MSEAEQKPPLEALQEALAAGRVRAAVRRRTYGDALSIAVDGLAAHGGVSRDLEKLALAAKEVTSHLDPSSRAEALQALASLGQHGKHLEEHQDTDGLRESRRRLGEAARLVSDVSRELERGWRARIAQEFETVGELGDVLAQMGTKQDLAERMQSTSQQGLHLRETFPPDEETLRAMREGLQARNVVLRELSAEGSEVGGFLLKVARRRATLADLAPEVQQWLERHGALTRFAVRLTLS